MDQGRCREMMVREERGKLVVGSVSVRSRGRRWLVMKDGWSRRLKWTVGVSVERRAKVWA
jgi:hypothetical protein